MEALSPTPQKGRMHRRILELALEALEAKKADLEKQIESINVELKRSLQSMEDRKTQSERMQEYWRRKRIEAVNPAIAVERTKAGNCKQRSPAQRKAQSKRMKAYWAEKKSNSAKSGKSKA